MFALVVPIHEIIEDGITYYSFPCRCRRQIVTEDDRGACQCGRPYDIFPAKGIAAFPRQTRSQ